MTEILVEGEGLGAGNLEPLRVGRAGQLRKAVIGHAAGAGELDGISNSNLRQSVR